jgi:hypothetical protein
MRSVMMRAFPLMYILFCRSSVKYDLDERMVSIYCVDRYYSFKTLKEEYYDKLKEMVEDRTDFKIYSREQKIRYNIFRISAAIRKVGIGKSVIKIYEKYKYDIEVISCKVIAAAHIYYYIKRISRQGLSMKSLENHSGSKRYLFYEHKLRNYIIENFEK